MTYEEWFAKMAVTRAIELNGPVNLDHMWIFFIAQVMILWAWVCRWVEDKILGDEQ